MGRLSPRSVAVISIGVSRKGEAELGKPAEQQRSASARSRPRCSLAFPDGPRYAVGRSVPVEPADH